MTTEPASIANDFCPIGEERGTKARCTKEAGHDGPHDIAPADEAEPAPVNAEVI